MFIQETEGICRLCVPFENLTTSVFLLMTQEGPVLYDCATTAADVENVVLPALMERGIAPENLRSIVISHAHADHSGGLTALLQYAPDLEVIARKCGQGVYTPADGEVLFGSLRALHLPGHTMDCLGLYDLHTDTLLTADALQLRGIGRFGCSLAAPEDYIRTIERIRCLAPYRILTAHAYEPYGEKAEGAAEIARYLCGCIETLEEIKAFVIAHRDLAAEEIAEAFRTQHPQWPLLPKTTVRHILEALVIS